MAVYLEQDEKTRRGRRQRRWSEDQALWQLKVIICLFILCLNAFASAIIVAFPRARRPRAGDSCGRGRLFTLTDNLRSALLNPSQV